MSENLSLHLIGGQTAEILWRVVNVLNRCDEIYCQAYQQQEVCDEEWNECLQAAEDELNRLGLPPHPGAAK